MSKKSTPTPQGRKRPGGSTAEERLKALDAAMAQINKEGGAGTIGKFGDYSTGIVAERTGILPLDIALGGGLAKGRIIEIYGPEASGKTSIALAAIAATQKRGGNAAIIDAEHALDPVWAKKFGVNMDDLVFSQPDHGEQATDTLNTLVNSGALDLIVVDSVAALTPKAELEGTMGDSNVGLQARMMSKILRKTTGTAARNGTTIIFINQLREKIGVMFGSPETTTGGKALKFYASTRLDVRRIEVLKEGTEPVGSRARVKVVKNKVAPPFKQAEFDLMFDYAFSLEGSLIDLAVEHDIMKKSGAWYTYPNADGGIQVGQGKENSRKFLQDNPEIRDEIHEKLNVILFPEPVEEAETPDGDEDKEESKNEA